MAASSWRSANTACGGLQAGDDREPHLLVGAPEEPGQDLR
jgi:hypothetical protein